MPLQTATEGLLGPFEERLKYRCWVTPKTSRQKPVHRWCVFPHSFTAELVHGLIYKWGLKENDSILDPFCGSGTTILTAKENGIPSTGYDLSPYAVFVSRVKIANYNRTSLERDWKILSGRIGSQSCRTPHGSYPDFMAKALPGRLLSSFASLDQRIMNLECAPKNRDFFRMALLSILPRYSNAVASGGWLKWEHKMCTLSDVPKSLRERVQQMLDDLSEVDRPHQDKWKVAVADVRALPDSDNSYSAVITSPPYPNRHDYTRIFGVELMFAFLDSEQTRKLRHESFCSHPESSPSRLAPANYQQPGSLDAPLKELTQKKIDPRIIRMLKGYFLDIYLCLMELIRTCRRAANVALVLGNVQYDGVPIPVDEITAEIGKQVGLELTGIVVIRHRGNSAQQMGKYQRQPSRESIVCFRVK